MDTMNTKDKKNENPKERLEKTSKNLSSIRSIVLDIIIITTIIVICLLIYRELNKETVIIEPFQVPTDLEKQNITGQAIVNKLLDQIEVIKANADTAYKKLDVKPVVYDSQLEIVIPGSGISLKSVLQNVKNFLGKKQTRISGEVVLNDQKLYLTIRVLGEPSRTFTGTLSELDDILKDASQYILKYTQPYLLAYYLYYNYEKADKDAAMDMIKFALTHPPADDDAMAYTLDGYIKYDEKNFDEAIKLFRKAIEIDPKSVDAYNNWAYILYERKDYDSAISLYKKSLEINPDYFYTYHYMGMALAGQKKYDEAIANYNKSILLNGKYADVYEDFGNALSELQKYDESIQMYNKGIDLDPNSFHWYVMLGNVFLKQKKYDDAIDSYSKAISLNPGSAEAIRNLGDILFVQQKYPEASAEYKKLIRIDPENKDTYPYTKLAITLEQEKKNDEAIAVYKKLISLAPADSSFFAEKILGLKK